MTHLDDNYANMRVKIGLVHELAWKYEDYIKQAYHPRAKKADKADFMIEAGKLLQEMQTELNEMLSVHNNYNPPIRKEEKPEEQTIHTKGHLTLVHSTDRDKAN